MSQKHNQFQIRSFAAIVLATTGIGLPVTGIVNHFNAFSGFTVARHAWMSAHNVLGVLFVLFALVHVLLNRRVLWGHLKDFSAGIPGISREAAWACGVVILSLLIAVGHAIHGRT